MSNINAVDDAKFLARDTARLLAAHLTGRELPLPDVEGDEKGGVLLRWPTFQLRPTVESTEKGEVRFWVDDEEIELCGRLDDLDSADFVAEALTTIQQDKPLGEVVERFSIVAFNTEHPTVDPDDDFDGSGRENEGRERRADPLRRNRPEDVDGFQIV